MRRGIFLVSSVWHLIDRPGSPTSLTAPAEYHSPHTFHAKSAGTPPPTPRRKQQIERPFSCSGDQDTFGKPNGQSLKTLRWLPSMT